MVSIRRMVVYIKCPKCGAEWTVWAEPVEKKDKEE